MKRTPEERQEKIRQLRSIKCWTNEFYDKAYDTLDHKMPLVIPSYNNPDGDLVKLINTLKPERSWDAYVVVRKSQEEEYKKYAGVVTVLGVEDSLINSLGKARHWIVEEFSKNYDAVFMMDDDTLGLDFSVPSKTAKGAGKSEYIQVEDFPGVLAMWQIAHENISKRCDRVLFSNISNRGFGFNDIFTDVNNSAMLLRGYPSLGCFAVNIRKLLDLGINYRHSADIGHEDYDVYFRCLEKGYINCQFAWLVCNQAPLKAGNYEDTNDLNERFKIQTSKLEDKLGYLPFLSFREVKGKYNSKIQRARLYKYLYENGWLPAEMEINIWDNGNLLKKDVEYPKVTYLDKPQQVNEELLWY